MEESVVALSQEVLHVEWAEVDLLGAICSRELGTGSALTRMYLFVHACNFLH